MGMTIEELNETLSAAANEISGLEQIPEDERERITEKINDAIEMLDEAFDTYGDGFGDDEELYEEDDLGDE
jgi:hypothetical protein